MVNRSFTHLPLYPWTGCWVGAEVVWWQTEKSSLPWWESNSGHPPCSQSLDWHCYSSLQHENKGYWNAYRIDTQIGKILNLVKHSPSFWINTVAFYHLSAKTSRDKGGHFSRGKSKDFSTSEWNTGNTPKKFNTATSKTWLNLCQLLLSIAEYFSYRTSETVPINLNASVTFWL